MPATCARRGNTGRRGISSKTPWSRYVATLGEIHPSTLRAAKQLAVACRKAGAYGEALRLSEQAYAAYQGRLGPTHPATLSAAGNLVNDLRITRDLGSAAALAAETLEQYRRRSAATIHLRSRQKTTTPSCCVSPAASRGHRLSEHAFSEFRRRSGRSILTRCPRQPPTRMI